MAARTVLVAPERVPGWIERFAARHGEVTVSRADSHVTLTADDGAVASYDDTPVPHEFGLVLVRRGGYAIGRVQNGGLVGSKCGTRYVQGRTKAGGWSQKRYARRRANQADSVARAAAEAIERVLAERSGLRIFGGGDRELVDQAVGLARPVIELEERWLDVREPRRQVLVDAVGQSRSVQMHLNNLA